MKKSNHTFQQPIDLDRLFRPVWKYWYVFALSIGLALTAALIYLNGATAVYEMQATILVRNSEEDGLTKDALQKEILGMGANPKTYEDVRILSSRTLLEAVADSLNLGLNLSLEGPRGNVDLYDEGPIDLGKTVVPRRVGTYGLRIHDSLTYTLQIADTETYEGQFGNTLRTPDGTFLLRLRKKNASRLDTTARYALTVGTGSGKYLGTFAVSYNENQPTILDLYVRDEVQQRGLDVLREAVEVYNRITLENKSRNRKNTLSFIEDRIDLLVTELNQVERELEQYKSRERLTVDFKADLPYIQDRIGYFEREIVDVEIQQNIMQYISTALDSNEYDFFPLVDFGLEHKGLSELITNYNGLVQERSRLRQTVTENYPAIALIDDKISSLRISIKEEVRKNLRELESRVAELNTKNQSYIAELNATPRRERELLDKERQRATKENLYTYLLEKREEAAVSIAAVGENAKLVDPPFVRGRVAPKPASVLMGAGLAGFLLPFGALLLFGLLDRRVRTREELVARVGVPVLGSIVAARANHQLVIRNNIHSPVAESFRSLRSSLDFLLHARSGQVVVVTSASIREGKSFTSVNLAMSYALSGKKVLLIDVDLRSPKVVRYLEVADPGVGIGDYLRSEADLEEIIHQYPDNENLHYIAVGGETTDPSELLMSDRFFTLLAALRSQYDLILLDTPAVGLVSDGLRLSHLANACLWIVRVGVTEKEDLPLIEEMSASGRIKNPAIVINGVSRGRTYQKALKMGYYQSVAVI